MQSVVSYPSRGHYGDAKFRGNTTGFIVRDLINQFGIDSVVDVCRGSDTTGDVCREMGIPYLGLDLRTGNDYTKDSALIEVLKHFGKPVSLAYSHPAYHDMIQYQRVWGDSNPADHSACGSVEEFLEKSQVMLLNQRECVDAGGYYATLIGDYRKNGQFHSFQSDFIQMMDKRELKSVVIKQQHNMMSNGRSYSGNFIPITHEYLLVWQKTKKSIYQVIFDKSEEFKKLVASTWRSLLRIIMMQLGQAPLNKIYEKIVEVAPDKVRGNPNWKAKVRQQLQMYHTHVEHGVWAA